MNVSDYVWGMMESGAVRLNNETGYLEDTSTGQKVDPETGERLTETPDVPETPAIPDTPGNQENPEVPEKPDTPGIPETPENQALQKSRTLRKLQRHRKNQVLQKNRTLRKLQRHRKNQALRKLRIARIPANPIPKIRFRHRILIRQILPKTGKIQRPTQFREVRSTIHRRSAKQKKQPVRTNQKLQSVILN